MKIPRRIKYRHIGWYPPYLGAGIRVKEVDHNFRRFEVELRLTWFNKNLFGTHFGGSLYSMCDPFFVFIILNYLGNGYIVWDKGACIEFRKPGRGRLRAVFEIPDEQLQTMKAEVDEAGKQTYHLVAQVRNSDDEVVAEVDKEIYIRKRD